MDKRSEPRFGRHFRFFVHVHECDEKPDLVGVSVVCEAVDMSRHGMQFLIQQIIPVGSTLNITIGVGDPFAMFLLIGEIRWLRQTEDGCFIGVLLREQEADFADWGSRFDEIFRAIEEA